MKQIRARVVGREDITSDIFRLTLFAPEIARESSPGQFIHLLCGEDQSFILRRPFSIHRIGGSETIDVLVRVVGKGSQWLARREPKDQIDAIGPLGRGFDFSGDIRRAVLVAGGIGIAPMVFLAKKLFDHKIRTSAVIGAAGRTELLDVMDLKRMTRRVSVATDDGSQGHHGLVTDIVGPEIKQSDPQIVYACGPQPMLRTVANIASRYGVSCQVSLEAIMACGIGACAGCAVESADGFLNVCSDGPVFTTNDLGWTSG